MQKSVKKSSFIRNLAVTSGAGLAAVAGSSHATIAADITTAIGDATGNVSAAAGGVVVVAAIMLGVGMIVSLFRK